MTPPTPAADKGKARAIDPVATSNDDPPASRLVKPQPIPSTSLLNIEYPGILEDDAGPSCSSSYSSLDRALSTLHPSALPPLTSSALEGLNFLSRIPNEGLKVVECRLGGFASHNASEEGKEAGSSGGSIDQVYKAPLIGEAVPTHNIVVRIVKRTWRQKKRKRASSASPAPDADSMAQADDMVLDPALFAEDGEQQQRPNGHDEHEHKRSRYTGRVKKEYCVEVLGLATHTVRFRSMADFAFQPDVTSSTANQLDPVMALHRALATMDLKAFQNLRIPEQLEDYQLPHPGSAPPKSNLHMVPPAFFSRMDVPFNYNFQQTPYSELRTVATPPHLTHTATPFAHALAHPTLPATQTQRFVNRVRLSNITPQPFRVGRDARVPTRPLPDVVRIEHRCDARILARLRALLAERPMWSRVALKNSLSDAELKEVSGSNEKVYYALVGYSMVGGPWRDTVVRFGYDVRRERESRVYQRIFLRGAPALREARAAPPLEGDGEDDDDEAAARSSVVPLPADRTRTTHLFDGTTLHRHVGNFQLCDIHDPLIQPYIWRTNDDDPPASAADTPIGTPWLRATWDAETGWYTRRALELIRALLAARFKALADTGVPLGREAVEAIVSRVGLKWSEEDAAPVGAQAQAGEAAHGAQSGIGPALT
ncbi:conserved hypothetical protein [Sporisorium reilianum SRZ2]|uniref:Uncharacterized protein n=1 Tax=Sporisorium reilianum (strain SRZ2) TaxID=999809 RepID=E7A0C9_SPORE|nr:conserved hypothetical protein [Sporisorium reilianum SRZ2]